jgi:hypothetical protein
MSEPNTISENIQEISGNFNADNKLRTGLKVMTSMNFSSGMAGANFAVYGIATGVGNQGSWGVHDNVGVHGTAIKRGKHWAAGMHCDVYDLVAGGTAIGLNVELPQTQIGTDTIAINIQPDEKSRDLTGIQIQNPKSFKYGVVIPNMSWVFGKVDTCLFGMRFDESSQSLKFYRSIGKPDETLVHEIKMDFGQAK